MQLTDTQNGIIQRIVDAIANTERQHQALHAQLNEVVRLVLGLEYDAEKQYRLLPSQNDGWQVVEVTKDDNADSSAPGR